MREALGEGDIAKRLSVLRDFVVRTRDACRRFVPLLGWALAILLGLIIWALIIRIVTRHPD